MDNVDKIAMVIAAPLSICCVIVVVVVVVVVDMCVACCTASYTRLIFKQFNHFVYFTPLC